MKLSTFSLLATLLTTATSIKVKATLNNNGVINKAANATWTCDWNGSTGQGNN